jgi:hypothetical protein
LINKPAKAWEPMVKIKKNEPIFETIEEKRKAKKM